MTIKTSDTSDVKTLEIASFAEVSSLIGSEVVTPWFQMDPERTLEFEHSTYLNEYPYPYEEEQGEGYGEGLVEGFHLLGMVDYLMNHVIVPKNGLAILPWNYGLDRVRFVSVVRNSDCFRLRGVLVDVQTRETGLRVTFDIVADVAERDRPAFVATQHALWTSNDQMTQNSPKP